jgi:hypothetical protein
MTNVLIGDQPYVLSRCCVGGLASKVWSVFLAKKEEEEGKCLMGMEW